MKKIYYQLLRKIQKKVRKNYGYRHLERGQVLVIVALSVIGLVAAVGLTVDVGLLYLNHGKLRRAVDAAALAATAQFREGYSTTDLENAAVEFLKLNGINDPGAKVETCESNPGDPVLCDAPLRKLVRVKATSVMPLAFLPVIGIREATVSASAVSEAASLDVVFAIDASDSMTYDAVPGDPMRDPVQCNLVQDCHPFEEVKDAAKAFIDQLYFPYDRVAIVTFDGYPSPARVNFSFADFDNAANKKTAVQGAINALSVVDPGDCSEGTYPGAGPCREYVRYADCLGGLPWANGDCDGDNRDEAIIDADSDGFGDTYLGFDCPIFHATGNPDTCGTTAIGSGFQFTGNEFAVKESFRQEALWVVILLTDGAANAPQFACPHTTWNNPFCRDNNAVTRHCAAGDTSCLARGGVVNEDEIDADDFARDMADFVSEDQNALVFTIGLGSLVRTSIPRAEFDVDTGEPILVAGKPVECDTLAANCWGAGEQFLRYAANIGGGNYYFAPSGDQLRDIFLEIASNIGTRLTQ